MSFSVLIDDDFTLFVEEDNDNEEEADDDIQIQIKTEPECGEADAEVPTVKEELDFEDNYLNEDEFVNLSQIKFEVHEAFEFEDDEIRGGEEIPPVAWEPQSEIITEDVPNLTVEEIPEDIPKLSVEELPEDIPNLSVGDVPEDSPNLSVGEVPEDIPNLSGEKNPEEIPNRSLEEIPEIQHQNELENYHNVTLDGNLDENSTLVTNPDEEDNLNPPAVIDDSSEKEEMNVALPSKEPLDRRKIIDKSSDNQQSQKVVPKNSKNNSNRYNNRQVVPYKKNPNLGHRQVHNGNNWKFPKSQIASREGHPKDRPKRWNNPKKFEPWQCQNNTQLIPNQQQPSRYFNNRPVFGRKENPLAPRHNFARNMQPKKIPPLPTPVFEPHNTSLYNQTYATILNVINQALGRRSDQNGRTGDPSSDFPKDRRRRFRWWNQVAARPPVWARDLQNGGPVGPAQPQTFSSSDSLQNSARLQTFSNILQAVAQLNGGGVAQNHQNFTASSNNFRFQMCFGSVTNFRRC